MGGYVVGGGEELEWKMGVDAIIFLVYKDEILTTRKETLQRSVN